MCHVILALPVLALPIFWFSPWGESVTIYAVIVLFSIEDSYE